MTFRRKSLQRAAAALGLCVLAGTLHAQPATLECGPGPDDAADPLRSTLFRIDGESYSESTLSPALQQALFDARMQLYQKQLEIIEAAVMELELERRAGRSGKRFETLAEELFPVIAPGDAQIEAFYRENQASIPYPLDAVRDQIRQMLVKRDLEARQAEFLAGVKRERDFEVVLAAPVAPYAEVATDGFPSTGAADAKVTVVEFADYQCPHCRRSANVLDAVAARHPDAVRIVVMDFPINRSGISRRVAEGAACADRQGAFWRYHHLAFERQETLDAGSAVELAETLELDLEAFRACLDSPFPRERVARSVREARRLGIRATPALFLNGRRLHLHDLERELPAAIDRALARGEAGS